LYLKETRILETETGSTVWHYVENSLCKRLWTCRKTDCGVMMGLAVMMMMMTGIFYNSLDAKSTHRMAYTYTRKYVRCAASCFQVEFRPTSQYASRTTVCILEPSIVFRKFIIYSTIRWSAFGSHNNTKYYNPLSRLWELLDGSELVTTSWPPFVEDDYRNMLYYYLYFYTSSDSFTSYRISSIW
jgi:hypothetical protein